MNNPMRQFSTPMMQQYIQIKEEYPDCLLFFRLGDFYELFLEDAEIGSRVLDITLTKRPRGKDGDIPMAGVPYHASDAYIAKLVRAGYKVAMCEQVSEPDSKGIVDREVVRIITPGTILDEKTLEKKEHNYTASISMSEDAIGFAVADLSTGDFQVTQIARTNGTLEQLLGTELVRFSPSECVVNETVYHDHDVLKLLSREHQLNVYQYNDWNAQAQRAKQLLQTHFNVQSIVGFGLEDKPQALEAAGSLLGYLSYTQKDRISHVRAVRTYAPDDFVVLDRSSIANLELFTTIRSQEDSGSVLSVIDHTKTAMGGRMLRTWMRKPLRTKESIQKRLDSVEELLNTPDMHTTLRQELMGVYDIERLLSRLSVGIGNAVDVMNLKKSLEHIRTIQHTLSDAHTTLLIEIQHTLSTELDTIIAYIEKHIVQEPPIDTKSGGIIQSGIHEELDSLRGEVGGGKQWVAELEHKEKERTGIGSLKIKFNQVFGYYIEISKAHTQAVPDDYIRKQTMVNAERYITPALKEYESTILKAEESAHALEHQLFLEVVENVLSYTHTLQHTSQGVAALDCIGSLSVVAEKQQYVKPQLRTDGVINITQGRHPVVEHILDGQFVPNDVLLDNETHQLKLITGPNMAGKSVYMRQVALLVLLTHMGSFIPATSAEVSLVDRIFVRSGASDVITAGLSTFMVEMVETAYILSHATQQSVIILDEIGRGTSTYDGISIAWAVAEYIVTHKHVAAKTLFASHYYELQALAEQYPDRIQNVHMTIEEKNGEPVFLYTVAEGGASHSYGVAVAKLAGVPEEVVAKAWKKLAELEQPEKKEQTNTSSSSDVKTAEVDTLRKYIKTVNINTLTPIEALQVLSDIQKQADD